MSNKIRVLLALETETLTQLVQEKMQEQYVIQTAKDAEDVYTIIHKFQPDLAVLDYSLTSVNPIELHEGIEFLHPNTTFVICATSENLEVARRIWLKRSIDYIRKPVDADMLIDNIHKIVRHIIDQRHIRELKGTLAELQAENKRLKSML